MVKYNIRKREEIKQKRGGINQNLQKEITLNLDMSSFLFRKSLEMYT